MIFEPLPEPILELVIHHLERELDSADPNTFDGKKGYMSGLIGRIERGQLFDWGIQSVIDERKGDNPVAQYLYAHQPFYEAFYLYEPENTQAAELVGELI